MVTQKPLTKYTENIMKKLLLGLSLLISASGFACNQDKIEILTNQIIELESNVDDLQGLTNRKSLNQFYDLRNEVQSSYVDMIGCFSRNSASRQRFLGVKSIIDSSIVDLENLWGNLPE